MTWQEILAIADQLEPEAAEKFLEAVTRLREAIDVDALAEAIAKGDTAVADLIVQRADEFQRDLQPLLDVVQQAYIQVGRAGAASLYQSLGIPMRFDITNPMAVSFARQAAADLVTAISTETKLAIRSIVTSAFTQGLTSRDTALLIRPLIGLTERQAMAVLNYRAGLIESGVAGPRVSALANTYAAKLLRQRAQTIARTEIMAAANEGQHALWQQATEQRLLPPDQKRRWIVTPDDRLCKRCLSLRNQVRGMTEPFVCPLDGSSVLVPPLHPRCRCVVVLVALKDLVQRAGEWVYAKAA